MGYKYYPSVVTCQRGAILMYELAIDPEGPDMGLDLDTSLGRAVQGMYGLNWRPIALHKVTVIYAWVNPISCPSKRENIIFFHDIE